MDKHLDGDILCDYAEGGLDATASASVDAHLRICADCRREVEIARGYFTEMSGLEPVKAPANFLANVRARLPQPSPWKRALMGFMRPWRAVPLQIAVLTVLGITVISTYLYQSGGIVSEPALESYVPIVPDAPVPMVPSPDTAGSAAEPEGKGAGSDARTESPVQGSENHGLTKAPRVAKKSSHTSGDMPVELMEKMAQPPPRSTPMATSQAEAAPDPGQAQRRIIPGSQNETGTLARAKPTAPASAPAVAKSEAGVPARQDRPKTNAMSEDSKEKDSGVTATETKPGFTVRMRTVKDTAAILAGLKAMGAEVISSPRRDEPHYMLRLPSSAFGEVGPYLERYGGVERQGRLSSAHPDIPAHVLLRMLPPGK
ncbi:MAG: hypothetical protein M3Y08_10175 [Fibrobacterota bacterium]|nr:hypothetical protein [Fibrobacterota bacterium]